MSSSSVNNHSRKQPPIVKQVSITCYHCKRSFLNKEDMMEHMEEENPNGKGKICARCSVVFDNSCRYFHHRIICEERLRLQVSSPSQATETVNQEFEENNFIVLPNIVTEFVTEIKEEPNTSTSAHKKSKSKKRIKIVKQNAPLPYHYDEQMSRKAEVKLISILHNCDRNIREKKQTKAKQICPVCDKLCDGKIGQDIRGHARVHGTVFLEYSQERLYRNRPIGVPIKVEL